MIRHYIHFWSYAAQESEQLWLIMYIHTHTPSKFVRDFSMALWLVCNITNFLVISKHAI